MTHPLAAQRCADLVKDAAAERNSKTSWREADFLDGSLYIGAIAFRRYVEAVSEAVVRLRSECGNSVDCPAVDRLLGQFVLREPVDPLVDAIKAVAEVGRYAADEQAALLRTELAKRGLHITEIGESTDANG